MINYINWILLRLVQSLDAIGSFNRQPLMKTSTLRKESFRPGKFSFLLFNTFPPLCADTLRDLYLVKTERKYFHRFQSHLTPSEKGVKILYRISISLRSSNKTEKFENVYISFVKGEKLETEESCSWAFNPVSMFPRQIGYVPKITLQRLSRCGRKRYLKAPRIMSSFNRQKHHDTYVQSATVTSMATVCRWNGWVHITLSFMLSWRFPFWLNFTLFLSDCAVHETPFSGKRINVTSTVHF